MTAITLEQFHAFQAALLVEEHGAIEPLDIDFAVGTETEDGFWVWGEKGFRLTAKGVAMAEEVAQRRAEAHFCDRRVDGIFAQQKKIGAQPDMKMVADLKGKAVMLRDEVARMVKHTTFAHFAQKQA